MSSIEDMALVTYSNIKCKDIWPMYFGQIKKYASYFKQYMFSDVCTNMYDDCTWCSYNADDPYYLQWTKCLEKVKEKYIIYMQEDFILYDNIDCSALEECMKFLETTDYSFVRLIRTSIDTNTKIHIRDNFYDVHRKEEIFFMQATLWKKEDIKNLYLKAQSQKWLEGPHWYNAANEMGIKGAFIYNNEPLRGRYHFDSKVFPYMCTAINRGLWNMNEYPNELGPLIKEYNIDPEIRGVRQDYLYRNVKK